MSHSQLYLIEFYATLGAVGIFGLAGGAAILYSYLKDQRPGRDVHGNGSYQGGNSGLTSPVPPASTIRKDGSFKGNPSPTSPPPKAPQPCVVYKWDLGSELLRLHEKIAMLRSAVWNAPCLAAHPGESTYECRHDSLCRVCQWRQEVAKEFQEKNNEPL